MRYYKLYYPMHEDIKEKYDELNYRTLEEIYFLPSEEEYVVELFWIDLNSLGKERCLGNVMQSEALNLFMHDIKSENSSLRKNAYPAYEVELKKDAQSRIAPEEIDTPILQRESWIICCEQMSRMIAQYDRRPSNEDDHYVDGYTKSFSFRFFLPKNVPEMIFSGTDLGLFITPGAASWGSYQINELRGQYLFAYALAAFYCALAKYHPQEERDRDIMNYFMGLA